MNVLALFTPVKHFILDVDGVLTNGQVLLMDNGEMARAMNIKDGYAMQLAIKKNYQIHIISGASSPAVEQRLARLGITEVYMGVSNKPTLVKKIIADNNLSAEQVLYMGDDIPDLDAMQLTGLPCCPKDAVTEIKQVSKYISPFAGGMGCVRDVIEKVLRLNKHWQQTGHVASI